MSIHSPITEAMRWFRGETKLPAWTILNDAGAAVNCSALALRFLLSTGKGQAALINKTNGIGAIAVSGTGQNIVTVTVDDAEYDDIPWGVYYYTLWDTTNDLVLAEGRAVLLQPIAQP